MKHYINPFNRVASITWSKLICCLLLLTGISFNGIAQINAYAKVTGISGYTLSLSDVNQTYHTFNAGDQIIIMQMQDNVVGSNTTNTSSFGTISNIANAGKFEVATINSISGMPASLTITGATTNTYNFGSGASVQIISFRKYGSPNYTTTAAINALAWNGKVGGVVALQVPGTLTIAHSITADGSGFRGGVLSSNYESTCQPSIYASSSANYAGKGEGIQINTTGLERGRAPFANGGGAGSDDNGGGAGGSNYSDGGEGGYGWTCSANPSGGVGGKVLSAYVSKSRVFMGGGGGGGQQNNSVGSAGGNGGGIVLIRANIITTSCSGSLKISASGNSAANSGNDGSGGGGAGGSVILDVNTFNVPSSCPLSILGNGGSGGNVTDAGAHGGGGGGGQGYILYSSPMSNTNVTNFVTNGTGGMNNSSGSSQAASGSATNNTGIAGNMGGTVLPVKLTDFQAAVKGASVLLSWNTSMEQGNDHFNVQRSTNGIQFSTIGTVKGAGNSSLPRSYSYTDLSPESGKTTYRLQQVDVDGTAVYSSTALIDISKAAKGMSVFPNPVQDHFIIQVPATVKTSSAVSVVDLAGKTLLNFQGVPVNGQLQVSIGNKLTPGVYAIRLNNNQQSFLTKVIVQ